MRSLSLIAATVLLAAPGMAQAATPPCLTNAEFTSLASFALPSVITGTTQRCSASLGAGAFLPRGGTQLAARYAEGKTASWPAARTAFLKLTGGSGDAARLLRDMPDASLQGMLESVLQGMVAQKIPVERCGTIDQVVRLLAPLPPSNMAELVSVMVALGTDDKAKPAEAGGKSSGGALGKLSICKA